MIRMTERQREVYAFILTFRAEHGVVPSIREMCAAFGWRSTNAAADKLDALERRGLIRRDDHARSRMYEVIGQKCAACHGLGFTPPVPVEVAS